MTTTDKQQFNVTLPAELIRAVKHRAIDQQLSLSDLLTQVLSTFLAEPQPAATDPVPTRAEPEPGIAPVRLQPMVHVQDMPAAVSFYEYLGASVRHGSRDGDWVLLDMGGAQIGLLAHPPNPELGEGRVELNFATVGPLTDLEARLRVAGTRIVRPTTDEGFGRQLQLASPDGLLIKINQLEPELYT